MFKALREKLGSVIGKFSKEVEETVEETVEEVPEEQVEKEEKKPEAKKEKKSEKKKVVEETVEKESEEVVEKEEEPDEVEEVVEEKKGFFGRVKDRITTTSLSEEKFEELFWDIELALIENNVASEVIEKVKEDLKTNLTSQRIARGTIEKVIRDTLKESIEEILIQETVDIEKEIKKKKPYVIAMIGVNGSGKTTTLAKLANKLKEKHSVIIAASDTFRAAAIDQLQEHADKLGLKLIRHDYKSDPTAVAFDAIKHAESKKIDVVIIDTAGRLHSNDNLMNELKKLERVCKPDLKIFVGESITGNDCVEQARTYNEMIGIDGIILSKVDVDDKGGAAISVSKITGKPILYLGNGQRYEDLEVFDKQKIIDGLNL